MRVKHLTQCLEFSKNSINGSYCCYYNYYSLQSSLPHASLKKHFCYNSAQNNLLLDFAKCRILAQDAPGGMHHTEQELPTCHANAPASFIAHSERGHCSEQCSYFL